MTATPGPGTPAAAAAASATAGPRPCRRSPLAPTEVSPPRRPGRGYLAEGSPPWRAGGGDPAEESPPWRPRGRPAPHLGKPLPEPPQPGVAGSASLAPRLHLRVPLPSPSPPASSHLPPPSWAPLLSFPLRGKHPAVADEPLGGAPVKAWPGVQDRLGGTPAGGSGAACGDGGSGGSEAAAVGRGAGPPPASGTV